MNKVQKHINALLAGGYRMGKLAELLDLQRHTLRHYRDGTREPVLSVSERILSVKVPASKRDS